MTHEVIEAVTGNDGRADTGAGLELEEPGGFPLHGAAAVLVAGEDGGGTGLFLGPVVTIRAQFVAASVGELDSDRAVVESAMEFFGLGIPPSGFAGVAAGAVEGAALDDGAVAIDDDVGIRSAGGGILTLGHGGCGGGTIGEVDDGEAAGLHGQKEP